MNISSHSIWSLTVVVIIFGMCVLGSWVVSAQGTPSPALQNTFSAVQRRVTKIEIASIAGKLASPREGAVLEILYDRQGLDVVLAGYAVRDDDDVWLLVKPQDTRTYHVFGPAKRLQQEDKEIWIVPDVGLPHSETTQRKHFLFRAAVAPKGASPGKTVDSLEQFATVSSPPVPVAVLKWVPESGGLKIDTIGGRPVEPRTLALEVEASADVSGTQPKATNGKVYLILHPANSQIWRVVGPAEVNDTVWHCRDVPFAEPGQPHWRYVDVFAFQSAEMLKPGPIDYSTYLDKMLAASYSVRVLVKDEKVPPAQKSPTLAFTRCFTPDGKIQNLVKDQRVLEVKDVEVSFQGTVQGLPQGKSLWALLNPVDTDLWIVQEGPALVSGDEWTLPRVRLEAPGNPPVNRFRLFIVVSDLGFSAGITNYTTWQRQSSAVSPNLIVERKTSDSSTSPLEMTLSIVRVAGIEVNSRNEVRVSSSGPIEIQADGVPPGAQIWIGKNEGGTNEWSFVPTIRATENTWMTPTIVFAEQNAHSDSEVAKSGRGIKSLIALITRTPLPVTHGDFVWWRSYAWAVSPMVRVIGAPSASLMGMVNSSPVLSKNSTIGIEGGSGSMPIWLWIWILLIVAAFVALECFFRMVSLTASRVRKVSEEAIEYIQGQVQAIPKPHVVRSVLGLLILGLGVFAIVGYFPIYQHVLRTVLNLSRQDSQSLALLLIIFIGLTGVVADITTRYGSRSDREGSITESEGRQNTSGLLSRDETRKVTRIEQPRASSTSLFGYIFWVFLIGLIALALLVFQGILYLEFYRTHAAEGSRVPYALGCAALFIAGIEMLNFYWASRLALDFIAWFLFHVFFLAPVYLLAKVALILEQIFQALPSKVSIKESVSENMTSESRRPISEEEARRIANLYILTKLGDHLRPSALEMSETAISRSWRVRVTDKVTEKEHGELHIDGWTGEVAWHPAKGSEVPA